MMGFAERSVLALIMLIALAMPVGAGTARAAGPATHSPKTGLPLVELPAAGGSDRLVILMSGDGGWRKLDKEVAGALRRGGVSVLGWNSALYFRSAKTSQQGSRDLAAAIEEYRERWGIKQVVLVGYSFGASAMPFFYNGMTESQRAQVSFVSLLGCEHRAAFRAGLRERLGFDGKETRDVLPEAAKIPPAMLQCIYGRNERDTICPELRSSGADVVMTEGGHHFDRDYAGLATSILRRWGELALSE